jgi:hypothetical protein
LTLCWLLSNCDREFARYSMSNPHPTSILGGQVVEIRNSGQS